MDFPPVKCPFSVLRERSTKYWEEKSFTNKRLRNRTIHECDATEEEIVSCVATRVNGSKCDIVQSSFDKSTLREAIILRSMVWNSIIRDCTIVDCEVLNCKLTNCEIVNSPPPDSDQPQPRRLLEILDRVRPDHLDLPQDDEFPYFPQYVECDFRGCEVRDIKMRWSKVNGGSTTNCSVLFCEVQDCNVDKLNVNVGNYFKECTHDDRWTESQTPLPLTVLPVEVRKRIFSLVTIWSGKTPPLIVALRPEKTLYNEALGVLVRENYFHLSEIGRINELIIPNMSMFTFSSIQRLSIMGFEVKGEKRILSRGDLVNCLLEGKQFPYLPHLRDLKLTETHDISPNDFDARIKAFIELARRHPLEKLSIKLEFLEKDIDTKRLAPAPKAAFEKCEEVLNDKIWEINRRLGIQVKNSRMSNYTPVPPGRFRHTGYRYTERGVLFTWEASKDSKLEWQTSNVICIR